MNYGYDPSPYDAKLFQHLKTYCATLPADKRGMRAYPEINGLYPGVRLRRITHYDEPDQTRIVHDCDEIYLTVCKGGIFARCKNQECKRVFGALEVHIDRPPICETCGQAVELVRYRVQVPWTYDPEKPPVLWDRCSPAFVVVSE